MNATSYTVRNLQSLGCLELGNNDFWEICHDPEGTIWLSRHGITTEFNDDGSFNCYAIEAEEFLWQMGDDHPDKELTRLRIKCARDRITVTISSIVKKLGIKEAAYHLVTGINGSWIYNALHKEMEGESFCANLVNSYMSDMGDRAPNEMLEHIKEGGPDLGDDVFWDILLDGKVQFTQYGPANKIEDLLEMLNQTVGSSDSEFTAKLA